MKVVTAEQMKRLDRCAIDVYGIPSIVLMENAALAVVDVIAAHYPDVDRAAVFCGTGLNGGDGFAIARHLANRGVTPQIFLVGESAKIEGDARTNLDICRHMQLPIREIAKEDDLDEALAHALDCDLIVDAIFGTGLTRELTGVHAQLVDALPALRMPVVAVDIPSGLDASSHRVNGVCVRADVTVTFALPKIAHIFAPAAEYCGEVVVADISIPHLAIAEEKITLELVTRDLVAPLFPPRLASTHKGTYGHVAIHAGSAGRSGAAILGARGALRTGAGLVTVIADPATAAIIDSISVESMTHHFNRPDGRLQPALENKDALLIGPGLPNGESDHAFTREMLSGVDIPTVMDAEALNAYAGRADEIAKLSFPRILTPHPGELARLLHVAASDVNDDRVSHARKAAELTRSIVLLKGHQTLIATPEGEVAINTTGNPGMATGGMGDVLGGIIAALLARGTEAFDAACAGAFIHGLAGDLLLQESGDTGLTAGDLADRIPAAINEVRRLG